MCRPARESATLEAVQELRFRILQVVERRADALPYLQKPGDSVLVSRVRDRLLVMRCPCDCGEDVIINLDREAGPAWVLYRTRRGVSLFPSVWRDTGCGSHYVIWDDRILLFSGAWSPFEDEVDREVDRRVLEAVNNVGSAVEFREIARSLDEVPWTVLASCRRLTSSGGLTEVVEGMYAPAPRRDITPSTRHR